MPAADRLQRKERRHRHAHEGPGAVAFTYRLSQRVRRDEWVLARG